MSLTDDLPVYPPFVTFFFLLGIMLIRYFLLSMGFYLYCLKGLKVPIESGSIPKIQIKRDIGWSLVSSVIFSLIGTSLIYLWQDGMTKIYMRPEEYGWIYYFFSLIIYLFLHDAYFYWTHRLLHRFSFKNVHFVHHESRIPTAWTSFSFHPLEALIQAIILPVLVVLIPIHWSMLFVFLSLMTVFGILNHLGYELYPEFLEKRLQLISATHHQLHHARVSVNFGLYFTFWDKFMGTEGYGERHE